MVAAGRADSDQDRDETAPADALYDSAERRREMAAELEGVADAETIEARVVADTNQAQPPQEAIVNAPRRTPVARRAQGRVGQAREQLRRPGRGR